MRGEKVHSNEKWLLKVIGIAFVVWTVFCALVLRSVLLDLTAKENQALDKSIQGLAEMICEPPHQGFIESKSQAVIFVALAWVLVGGTVGSGCYFAFWKARYRIDCKGNIVPVVHSWASRQLFVDGELQDERTDFHYGAVDLHGKFKRGDLSNKEVRISFAPFGSACPSALS